MDEVEDDQGVGDESFEWSDEEQRGDGEPDVQLDEEATYGYELLENDVDDVELDFDAALVPDAIAAALDGDLSSIATDIRTNYRNDSVHAVSGSADEAAVEEAEAFDEESEEEEWQPFAPHIRETEAVLRVVRAHGGVASSQAAAELTALSLHTEGRSYVSARGDARGEPTTSPPALPVASSDDGIALTEADRAAIAATMAAIDLPTLMRESRRK